MDLNELLITHASSTYFVRLENDAPQFELHAGDILQINRALQPRRNDLALVFVEGEAEMQIIRWSERQMQELWGAVETVIRKLRS